MMTQGRTRESTSQIVNLSNHFKRGPEMRISLGPVLAVNTICFKSEVVVSDGSIKGMDLTGLIQGDFDAFIKEMTGSKNPFLKSVNEH
jgi:hypothetical protein